MPFGEKLELAKQLSGKLVEKYPDNTTYLDTYAWVLYMLKDYQQARKYLEKVAPNSNNGTILEHFGDVLYKLGETEKSPGSLAESQALWGGKRTPR